MKNSLLLAFAAANAVLYAALLPLWEGFDEPFHYGYVQALSHGAGLPDERSGLSREIAVSIALAPASLGVQANLPRVTSYPDFFRRTAEQRAQVRAELSRIPREYQREPSDIGSYEAFQAPLAYALLALPDRVLSGMPLPARILMLRILAGVAGSLLLYGGGRALCGELRLGEPHRSIALFCALATQMTWATLAHVDNDWLAAPLAVWTLVLLIRAAANPGAGRIAAVALALAAGLLAKAYCLALAPLVLGVCGVRRGWRGLALAAGILAVCAGPWYARNLRIYGSLTGMPGASQALGTQAILRAAPGVNWAKMALDSLRMALWTGNNSGRTFSMATLDALLAVALVGVLLWVFSGHARAEWLTAAYCAFFMAALAYDGVYSTLMSHGAAPAPGPWYAQTVEMPLLVLCLLGASRWRRTGTLPAVLLPLLFGYVLAVTYVFKLIPLYAGYEGRGSVREIAALNGHHLGEMSARLGSAALGPVGLIYALTGLVTVTIVVLEVLLLSEVFRHPRSAASARIRD